MAVRCFRSQAPALACADLGLSWQHPTARQPKFVEPWQVVAQKAKAAHGSDDPAAVGEFVDEIFQQSLFHGMAASVKVRIARAKSRSGVRNISA